MTTLVLVSKKRGAGIPGPKGVQGWNGHRNAKTTYRLTPQDLEVQRVKQLRRQGRPKVEQGAPRVRFKEPETKLGLARSAWRRDRASVLAPAAVVGGSAVAADRLVPRERQLAMAKRDQQRTNPASERAMAAAATGTAAHLATGYHLKHKAKVARERFNETATPSQRAANLRRFEQHKVEHRITGKPGSWSEKASMQSKPEFTRQYPKELPGAKYKRALGHMSGRKGVAIGAGFAAVPAAGQIMVDRSRAGRGKRQVAKKAPLKATEFESGNAHEQLSGESQRRRVAAAGLGWNTASAATATGASGLLAARTLGRPAGQAALKGVARKYPVVAGDVKRIARVSREVARHPKKVLGGSAALIGTSVLTGTVGRFRDNEEAGISQGLGRIKAGRRYSRDLEQIGKGMSPLQTYSILGELASDPQVQRAAQVAYKHKKPLAAGVGVTAAGAATHQGVRRGRLRATERRAARNAVIDARVGKAATYGVQEKTLSPLKAAEGVVGIAGLAWGGSRLKMTGKLVGRGVKAAGGKASQGRAAVDSVRRATGRGESLLRGRVKGFGTALDTIPAPMRAATVTGAGAALTLHSLPWQKKTFHPTNRF